LLVLAFAMRLVYRKRPYTFTETLVFTLYTYGVSYLFSCLLTALLALHLSPAVQSYLFYTIYFLSLTYLVWAMRQFYGGKGVRSWVKAVATHVVSYALFFLLVFVAGIAVAVVWKFTR